MNEIRLCFIWSKAVQNGAVTSRTRALAFKRAQQVFPNEVLHQLVEKIAENL